MDRRHFLQGAGLVALGATGVSAAASATSSVGLNSEHFPHWRKAVADVKANRASSKVLFVGTSITLGAGTGTEFPTESVPAFFAQLANTSIAAATQTLGAVTPATPVDTRFSLGAGWYPEGGGKGLGWANVGYIAGNPGGGSLTFTPAPAQEVDTFDVWFIGNRHSGSMAAGVNGGPDIVINTTQHKGIGIAKATIRCASGTSNVLSLHTVFKGTVFVFAIDAYRSTETALHVGNAGVSGLGTALNWATPAPGSSLSCLAAYRPHLTVIALGGDDALISGPPTPVPAFTKAVQSVIRTAQRSGDVLLWTEPLSEPGGQLSVPKEEAYANALHGLASKHRVGLVDMSALSHTVFFDQYHPNQQGNADIAQALVDALALVSH